jgi:hypothetical protein
MKTYTARRCEEGTLQVEVDGQPLNPQFDIRVRNPEGFDCGYAGEGAAQLSLALLVDHLGNSYSALKMYEWFKWNVAAHLSKDGWILTSEDIEMQLRQAESLKS